MPGRATASPRTISAADLARLVEGELRHGPGDLPVDGIRALDEAGRQHVTFAADVKHARAFEASAAGVLVVSAGCVEEAGRPEGRSVIVVPDAELAVIRVLELFAPETALPDPGVHPTASVHGTAVLGSGSRVGPHVSVGPDAQVGAGVVLQAGARIGARAVVGDGCVVHANAVVGDRCVLGRGVILWHNVSIGADGFNYRPDPSGQGLLKVPHIGTVVIEDGVEIGAGSCVDRGKFGETRIGAGTKIDNLCQIGHNCRIGRCCVIAGLAGLAGSVMLGDGVMIGGHVGVQEHRRIGAGARVAASSMVMSDVPPGETWAGTPAAEWSTTMRQHAAFRKLPATLKSLKKK